MAKPIIMVVDDEIDVANVISDTIKDSGKYEVVTAYSAKEALEKLTQHRSFLGLGGNKIRLVFLDIKMPEIDGLQLLEKIRKDYGEDIGIAMLTAWEDEEKWDRATSGFVINYIKKPFKSEELLATIDKYFEGKDTSMVLNTFEKHIEKREEFKKKG
ncbi:MAG: response regulator [Candidatus Margulisiibacteriota bacterium]|jgi:CheY-like chemotaxis protein